MSTDVTTYSDDKCLGAVAPSLELLVPVRGDKLSIEKGNIYVLYFFTTFYKGGYPVNEEFTKMYEELAKDVKFIAISNEAEQEKLERFLGKQIVDENTKEPLRLEVPYVLHDEKKATAKTYADLSNLAIMSCPAMYIIDKEGKVAWRQQFLQTYMVKDSNFVAQLKHVIAGEPLESNGPRPAVEVDEGEVANIADDDLALF